MAYRVQLIIRFIGCIRLLGFRVWGLTQEVFQRVRVAGFKKHNTGLKGLWELIGCTRLVGFKGVRQFISL